MDGSKVGENAGASAARAGHRNILQALQRIDSVLWSLRRYGIAHAGLRVQPKFRRRLKTAAQRNQQVRGNVALGEADLLGFGPVDINMQIGLIERLLDVQINRSANLLDSLQQLV